jgi:integrase
MALALIKKETYQGVDFMVTYHILTIFALMGRKRNTIPNRLRHRPPGQDRIVWRGKTIYLGRSGSAEADAAYRRVVKSIMETGEPVVEPSLVTCRFLADRFLVHVRETFPADSREPMAYERAMSLLTDALGDAPASSVTPAKFAAMRDAWARAGKSVRTVNRHHNQILAAFRWGVTVELVDASVWHALQAVPRLRPRRSLAKDPQEIGPVEWAQVEAIRSGVRPQVWSMILTQWHTGMRSGEMLEMTPAQITDWVYRPGKHKNAWRGHAREIPIGPKCREVLEPWITGKDLEQKVFSGYTPQSYGRAIARACESAGVPRWHPHQLRHAYASRIRALHGLDAAQVMLGHRTARTTEIYAERNIGVAKGISDEIG